MSNSHDERGDVYDDADDLEGYQYDDPDEFHRIRRLRQIHDARDRFEKVRLKAREAEARGQVGISRDAAAAQTALDYVRQLEPIIKRADSDILDRTVVVESTRVRPVDNVETRTEPMEVTVTELLNQTGEVETQVSYTKFDAEINTEKRHTTTVTVTISPQTSLRLVRLCDDFLESVMPSGLSETSDDTWEI